jgi:hypothetical protein
MATVEIKPTDLPGDSFALVQSLFDKLSGGDTVTLSGDFGFSQALYLPKGGKNITVVLQDALLKKLPGFTKDRGIINALYCEDLTIEGGELYGLSPDKITWGDDGISLASCKRVTMSGTKFRNFGDGAWRICTSPQSTERIDSRDVHIFQCSVTNCTQATTTNNQDATTKGGLNGGCENILVEDSDFTGLRGSVKFGTRAPASKVIFRRNTIDNSSDKGIEVMGYTGVEIIENYLEDIHGFPLHLYFEGSKEKPLPGFPWGHYLNFSSNETKRTGKIRISNNAAIDGFKQTMHHLRFSMNECQDLTTYPGTDALKDPMIHLVNGDFDHVEVFGNKGFNIPSGKFFAGPTIPDLYVANNEIQ